MSEKPHPFRRKKPRFDPTLGNTGTGDKWVINLRHDQRWRDAPQSQSKFVRIYAPEWVNSGIKIISDRIQNVAFDNDPAHIKPELDVIGLHRISLNEPRNTRGPVNWSYIPTSVKKETVLAAKDLTRFCVMVGMDETTAFGGFGGPKHVPQKIPVVVINSIGLQFQVQDSNTGRICLGYDGLLFDLIRKNVLGHKYEEYSQREHELGKLDLDLYRAIISKDIQLIAYAANDTHEWHHKKVHLKILRLGLGFFSGVFMLELEQVFMRGVIDGLDELLGKHDIKNIKVIEFPFGQETSDDRKRLKELSEKYGLEFKYTKDDVLKGPSSPDLMLVVTNCGDNHVVLGNEMNYGSVDGMIGENIKSKGFIFNPNLNHEISYQFVNV